MQGVGVMSGIGGSCKMRGEREEESWIIDLVISCALQRSDRPTFERFPQSLASLPTPPECHRWLFASYPHW